MGPASVPASGQDSDSGSRRVRVRVRVRVFVMATVGATATARDDLRELGQRAAAQLHHLVRVRARVRVTVTVRVRLRLRPRHLVPQRLRQAEALLERHGPRARRRGPLALGAPGRYGEIW